MTAMQTAPDAANQIVRQEAAPPPRLLTNDDSAFANLLDTAKFEHMWRVSKMYAASRIVPQHFQDSPENCFIAIQMAVRLGVDPFMFMQKTFVVGGKPGMEAQLAIALVNSRGPFKGAIQWKMEGEGMGRQATAYAVHRETGEVCECTVSMKVAEAEGWLGKSGSKWRTMPEQMLRYRSAAWLARLYAPECLMGMQTSDELDDVVQVRQVENVSRPIVKLSGAGDIAERLTGRADIIAAPDAEPADTTPAPSAADELKRATAAASGECAHGKPGCSEDPGDFSTVDGKKTCANHAPAAAPVEGGLPGLGAKSRKK